METAAVFLALVGLLGAAWARGGDKTILLVLSCNFAATAAIDRTVSIAPDKDAALIMADLATIYALRFLSANPRAYAIGMIGLSVIMVTTFRIGSGSIGNYGMAVLANIAFAAQVLIGWGLADDAGRRLYNRLVSFWPRGACLLRSVAGG